MSLEKLHQHINTLESMHGDLAVIESMNALKSTPLFHVEKDKLKETGIHFVNNDNMMVFVTDKNSPIGGLKIDTRHENCFLIVHNDSRSGSIHGNVMIPEDNCMCVLSKPDHGFLALRIVVFRAPYQLLYMGNNCTAVEMGVEIEGKGKYVFIGEDALFSSGIMIRNHDMHSIVDFESEDVLNKEAANIMIEPHVWIGQDVLVLKTERVGFGSILGAKALIRQNVPPLSIAAGVPGKVIRSNTTWGRASWGLMDREKTLLRSLAGRNGPTEG